MDICPISNYKLQVFDQWENYPVREFLKRGIPCTISTDDPLSFANSLNDEYLTLHQKMGFSAGELAQFAKFGFEGADLPDVQKANYINEIDRLIEEDGGTV